MLSDPQHWLMGRGRIMIKVRTSAFHWTMSCPIYYFSGKHTNSCNTLHQVCVCQLFISMIAGQGVLRIWNWALLRACKFPTSNWCPLWWFPCIHIPPFRSATSHMSFSCNKISHFMRYFWSYCSFQTSLPHCGFDDDICSTVQAPLAAEGWPSGKRRLANKSTTLPLCPPWQIVYSWLQFNPGAMPLGDKSKWRGRWGL